MSYHLMQWRNSQRMQISWQFSIHFYRVIAVLSSLFQIAENLVDLVQSDYPVRKQIRESLENNYIRNRTQPFAAHIAF